MTKEELKRKAAERDGVKIPENTSLVDAHRVVQKQDGGRLELDNVTIMTPGEHRRFHGNYRDRCTALEEMKAALEIRSHQMRIRIKIQNQLDAYKSKADHLDPRTVKMLEEDLKYHRDREKPLKDDLSKKATAWAKFDRLSEAALGVKGVGPVTIAYMAVYVDLKKAKHVSNLWSYIYGRNICALDRFEKSWGGKVRPGNRKLRTALYTMADAQMKGRGAYRLVYDACKARLEVSDDITRHRFSKNDVREVAWKDTSKGHRHAAALRLVAKHFAADYWYVGRTIMGLPVDAAYPALVRGGEHRIIMPDERGWEW